MEKFLWNVIGALLVIANVLAIMLCVASGSPLWGIASILLAIADGLYARYRPVWMEV